MYPKFDHFRCITNTGPSGTHPTPSWTSLETSVSDMGDSVQAWGSQALSSLHPTTVRSPAPGLLRARRPPPGAPATPRTHHTGLAPATAQHRPPSSEPALRPPWGAAQDPRARLCPPRGTAQGGAAPGAPCATRACRRVPGTAERMGWAGGTTWVGLHADVGPGHVVADGALALQWHALRGGSRVAVARPGAVATARHAHGRGGQRALRRLLHGHVARTCRGEGPGAFNPCKADGLTAPPRAPSGRGLRPLVRAPGATAGPHPRPGARRSCQKVLWSPKP